LNSERFTSASSEQKIIIFLNETPNGKSTKRILEAEGRRAVSIQVSDSSSYEGAKDVVLDCAEAPAD
jgi:hypothetical protein